MVMPWHPSSATRQTVWPPWLDSSGLRDSSAHGRTLGHWRSHQGRHQGGARSGKRKARAELRPTRSHQGQTGERRAQAVGAKRRGGQGERRWVWAVNSARQCLSGRVNRRREHEGQPYSCVNPPRTYSLQLYSCTVNPPRHLARTYSLQLYRKSTSAPPTSDPRAAKRSGEQGAPSPGKRAKNSDSANITDDGDGGGGSGAQAGAREERTRDRGGKRAHGDSGRWTKARRR